MHQPRRVFAIHKDAWPTPAEAQLVQVMAHRVAGMIRTLGVRCNTVSSYSLADRISFLFLSATFACMLVATIFGLWHSRIHGLHRALQAAWVGLIVIVTIGCIFLLMSAEEYLLLPPRPDWLLVDAVRRDFNRDCVVDAADVHKIARRWHQSPNPKLDLDRDGDTDIVDIMQVTRWWGTRWRTPGCL